MQQPNFTIDELLNALEPLIRSIVREEFERIVNNEIIESHKDEKQLTDEFLSVCGTWEDNRSVEEQINDIYLYRKSRKFMEVIL